MEEPSVAGAIVISPGTLSMTLHDVGDPEPNWWPRDSRARSRRWAQAIGKIRSEPVAPPPYRFVGNVSALSQDQLKIPQFEAEHVVQRHGSAADDLSGEGGARPRINVTPSLRIRQREPAARVGDARPTIVAIPQLGCPRDQRQRIKFSLQEVSHPQGTCARSPAPAPRAGGIDARGACDHHSPPSAA